MQYKLYFIFILILLNACKQQSGENSQEKDTIVVDKSNQQQEQIYRESWEVYTNQQFNFTLKYPDNWRVFEDNPGDRYPVINVYSSRNAAEFEVPLDIHSKPLVSYLVIYPKGMGTELPSGGSVKISEYDQSIPVNFSVEQDGEIFLLENGDSWGYFLPLGNAPQDWDQGFIFAQIAINNFEAKCYDEETGEEVAMEECDPMTGDKIKKYGNIHEEESKKIKGILKSFKFLEGSKEQQAGSDKPGNDKIKVEQPLPDEDIKSPLTVKGEARGMWYFEGDFPVELQDSNGNVLVEAVATAQGKWMTEDFVPFSATLIFDAPANQKGYLVFKRANPSGRPENAASYKVPVSFPPDN